MPTGSVDIKTFCGDGLSLQLDPVQSIIYVDCQENQGMYNVANITLSLADAESLKLTLDAFIKELTNASA